MSTQEIFNILLGNLMSEIEGMTAGAIVDKDGLIISSTTVGDDSGDNKIGASTAMFDNFLARIKTEFGSATDFFNVSSIDDQKYVFIDAGPNAILTLIASEDTDNNELKVFGEAVAEKISFFLDGEEIDTKFTPVLHSIAKMRSGKVPPGTYAEKVIIMGDPMVGKTSLIRRFCDNAFKTNYISTIGVDISRKDVLLTNDTTISLSLWDIGGQVQTMAPYRKRFYTGASFAIIQFDITRSKTFENVDKWLTDLNQSIQKKLPVVLIANKVDMDDHEVTAEEIKEKAASLNCPYLITSAKTGSNVNEVFKYAAYKFLETV